MICFILYQREYKKQQIFCVFAYSINKAFLSTISSSPIAEMLFQTDATLQDDDDPLDTGAFLFLLVQTLHNQVGQILVNMFVPYRAYK